MQYIVAPSCEMVMDLESVFGCDKIVVQSDTDKGRYTVLSAWANRSRGVEGMGVCVYV